MASQYTERTSTVIPTSDHTEIESESTMTIPNEEQSLLQSAPVAVWTPPRGFIWIQLGE